MSTLNSVNSVNSLKSLENLPSNQDFINKAKEMYENAKKLLEESKTSMDSSASQIESLQRALAECTAVLEEVLKNPNSEKEAQLLIDQIAGLNNALRSLTLRFQDAKIKHDALLQNMASYMNSILQLKEKIENPSSGNKEETLQLMKDLYLRLQELSQISNEEKEFFKASLDYLTRDISNIFAQLYGLYMGPTSVTAPDHIRSYEDKEIDRLTKTLKMLLKHLTNLVSQVLHLKKELDSCEKKVEKGARFEELNLDHLQLNTQILNLNNDLISVNNTLFMLSKRI